MSKLTRECLLIDRIDMVANICHNFLTKKKKTSLPYVVDITENYFEDEEKRNWFIFGIVTADIVTCSTMELQEIIYLNTERLATLIEDTDKYTNVEAADLKNEDPNTLKVLWYGEKRDIFSFKQDVIKYKDLVDLALVYTTEPKKTVDRMIYSSDIVYLPKTSTPIGELARARKVIECVVKGKFVIANELPVNYQDMTFNGSLTEGMDFYKQSDTCTWIEQRQKLLQAQDKEIKINATNTTKLNRA